MSECKEPCCGYCKDGKCAWCREADETRRREDSLRTQLAKAKAKIDNLCDANGCLNKRIKELSGLALRAKETLLEYGYAVDDGDPIRQLQGIEWADKMVSCAALASKLKESDGVK